MYPTGTEYERETVYRAGKILDTAFRFGYRRRLKPLQDSVELRMFEPDIGKNDIPERYRWSRCLPWSSAAFGFLVATTRVRFLQFHDKKIFADFRIVMVHKIPGIFFRQVFPEFYMVTGFYEKLFRNSEK